MSAPGPDRGEKPAVPPRDRLSESTDPLESPAIREFQYEELAFRTERDGDRYAIRVVGELDIATAPRLRELIGETPIMNPLVVDLSECPYLDSSALTVLAQASKIRGDRLIVVIPLGARIRKVFQITGLDRALNLRTPD